MAGLILESSFRSAQPSRAWRSPLACSSLSSAVGNRTSRTSGRLVSPTRSRYARYAADVLRSMAVLYIRRSLNALRVAPAAGASTAATATANTGDHLTHAGENGAIFSRDVS